jgi:hypothetical protein
VGLQADSGGTLQTRHPSDVVEMEMGGNQASDRFRSISQLPNEFEQSPAVDAPAGIDQRDRWGAIST